MRFNKKTFKAAAYLRLSREDGDKAESDSITNQRAMVREYVSKHPDLVLTKEYVDDGYSGTRFDRPGFTQMIEAVKAHKIDCIVVKDLSRLGRNYIETGRYLEQIFPLLDVRFIAILDSYDNADDHDDADQIIIPFKNLINDAYCRELSQKVRSHLDIKRKNGKFIGSFAAYGYIKDPKDKNRLLIDEYPAEIVRHIYKLRLNGYNSGRIARKLEELGVLTPMEYKRKSGLNFNSGFRGCEKPRWYPVTVDRILKNELYIGVMLQGKNKKINYKVKESRPIEKEKWIRVEKTHDAIIPQPVFEAVQELAQMDTRTSPVEESVYIFAGVIRCGDCNQNMVRRISRAKNTGVTYFYYNCSTYKHTGGCTPHLISEGMLTDAVLKALQSQLALLLEAEAVIAEADKLPEEQMVVRLYDKQLAEAEAEAERYKNLKAKLYQDLKDGEISREEYAEINRRFSAKVDNAEKVKETILKKRQRQVALGGKKLPWLEEFKTVGNIQALDRRTVVTLVDRIIVHKGKKVEVVFRFGEEMDEYTDYALECLERNGKPGGEEL